MQRSRILVESARRKQSLKHGGKPLPLSDMSDPGVMLRRPAEEVIAISDALDCLTMQDQKAAELVKLRYFAGFTIPEAAEVLGVSPRTADNLWAYARAWLADKVRPATSCQTSFQSHTSEVNRSLDRMPRREAELDRCGKLTYNLEADGHTNQ